MIGEFQPLHWLLVLVVGVLLFGSKRLPEVGRSLGQSVGAFKKGLKEGLEDEKAAGGPVVNTTAEVVKTEAEAAKTN
jgi:sec-independent protein translocase protein TatA